MTTFRSYGPPSIMNNTGHEIPSAQLKARMVIETLCGEFQQRAMISVAAASPTVPASCFCAGSGQSR
jgi:hypothetical protein